MVSTGPLETFEQVSAHAAKLGWLFYAAYFNAAMVTLSAVAIGMVFVPIYGVLNLIVYLSQVTLVPALFVLQADPRYADTVDLLQRLTLPAWTDSAVAFYNGLAYGFIAIAPVPPGGRQFHTA